MKISNKYKITLIIILFFIFIYVIFMFGSKSEESNQIVKNKTETTPTPNIISITEKIPPIADVSYYNNSELIGISRKNGNLIKYSDGLEKIIYTGSVMDYDIQGNIVVVLDENLPDRITIIDLEKNINRTIKPPNLPIISVTLSTNKDKIFYLGEFSINNKNPSINSVSIDGKEHIKIGTTYAQDIKYLNENMLLLFQDNHDENKGILFFYNIGTASVSLKTNCNSFLISPDNKNVSTKSTNRIDIINTDTFIKNGYTTPPSNRHLWKDPNTVVIFQNNNESIYYSILNINNPTTPSFSILKSNSNIQTPIGFINNKLIWQDYDENFLSIEFQ